MPARKHRTGEELIEWEARKERHRQRVMFAREQVKSLSGHTLLRLDEAAAMLHVTKKTLRELELQGQQGWPSRVTISPKVTGYRLADMEAYIEACMALAPAEETAGAI